MADVLPIRVRFLTFADRSHATTDRYCALCLKDLRPGRLHREILLTENAGAVHPDDEARLPTDRSPFEAVWTPSGQRSAERVIEPARQPIGVDCAKRIGLEWSRPANAAADAPPARAVEGGRG